VQGGDIGDECVGLDVRVVGGEEWQVSGFAGTVWPRQEIQILKPTGAEAPPDLPHC
jgi:hypothetical protein